MTINEEENRFLANIFQVEIDKNRLIKSNQTVLVTGNFINVMTNNLINPFLQVKENYQAEVKYIYQHTQHDYDYITFTDIVDNIIKRNYIPIDYLGKSYSRVPNVLYQDINNNNLYNGDCVEYIQANYDFKQSSEQKEPFKLAFQFAYSKYDVKLSRDLFQQILNNQLKPIHILE